MFIRFYLPNLSKLFKFRLSLLTIPQSASSLYLQPCLQQLQYLFDKIVVCIKVVVKSFTDSESLQLVNYQVNFFKKVTLYLFALCAKQSIKLYFYRNLLR